MTPEVLVRSVYSMTQKPRKVYSMTPQVGVRYLEKYIQ